LFTERYLFLLVWDTAGEIDQETGWIGMACETYGVEGKMYIWIWWRNLKERSTLKT
jgi:hypothetical protein